MRRFSPPESTLTFWSQCGSRRAWAATSFFFSSRRRHTRCLSDWSSDVCSSDLPRRGIGRAAQGDVHVTVVIPTYNRGHVVMRAVTSALAQTHADLDVLVVDDGSTDDTADRLKTIEDPRLQYVVRPHAGASATRSAGVKLATGHFVSFLDSDDEWKPHKLECERAFFEKDRKSV